MTRRQALAATLAVLGALPVVLAAFVVAAYAEEYGGSFGDLAPAGGLVGVVLAVWLLACSQLAGLPQRVRVAAIPAGVVAGVLLLVGAAAWGGSTHEPGVPGDSVVGPVRAPASREAVTGEPVAHPSARGRAQPGASPAAICCAR
jgi:hypothetical protein